MITKDFKQCKRHKSPQIEDSDMDEEVIRSDQKKHKKMIKQESKQNNINLHQDNQVDEVTEGVGHLNINDMNDRNDSITLYSAQKSQIINSPNRNRMESSRNKKQLEQLIMESVKEEQNGEDFSLIEYDFQ